MHLLSIKSDVYWKWHPIKIRNEKYIFINNGVKYRTHLNMFHVFNFMKKIIPMVTIILRNVSDRNNHIGGKWSKTGNWDKIGYFYSGVISSVLYQTDS